MAEGAADSAPTNGHKENLNLLLKHLKFTDGSKPKFNWLGNKEELGQLVQLVFGNLNQNENLHDMKWMEDVAHNMVSTKYMNLTFKLYTTTTTLVIQGQGELSAKSKLYDLLNSSNETSKSNKNLGDKDINGGENDTSEKTITEETLDNSIIIDAYHLSDVEDDVHDKAYDIDSMKRDVLQLKRQMGVVLSKDFMQIENLTTKNMTEELYSLKQQVLEITLDRNRLLKNIDDLEKEKASLITVIRILQEDKPITQGAEIDKEATSTGEDEGVSRPNDHSFNEVKSKKTKTKKKSNTRDSNKTKTTREPNKERRSSTNGEANTYNSSTSKTTTQSEVSEDNSNHKQSTLIIGDSIINRLSSYQLSKSAKSKVTVRSFSGAHVRDIRHYLVPSMHEPNKPTKVILHVGTNDLADKSPQTVADEIQDLAHHIEHKYDSAVCISEITQRFDSDKLNCKVKEVNKIISKYCRQ